MDSPNSTTSSHVQRDAAENETLMRRATYAAVSVAVILILAKLVAWVLTDSVSLLATLIDSLLDVAASLVNLLAVRHALQPADREHRFGHGKAEALAGLGQAAFIAGSAAFLLVQAVERLVRPREIVHGDVGIAVMIFSIMLTGVLVLYQRYVIRRTRSLAIGADSLHYQSDLFVNGSVILSIVLATKFDWRMSDPAIAIGLAAYIVWGSWQIGLGALNVLMDRELPDTDRKRIREIALAHPEVKGVHDLRTRSAGAQLFIQLHLELDGQMSLRDVHVISDIVEREIQTAFPNAEVIIHEDPEGINESHPQYR